MKSAKALLLLTTLSLSSVFVAQDEVPIGTELFAVRLTKFKCVANYEYEPGDPQNTTCGNTCDGVCFKRASGSVFISSCRPALPADVCSATYKDYRWNVQTATCNAIAAGCGCDSVWTLASSQVVKIPTCSP